MASLKVSVSGLLMILSLALLIVLQLLWLAGAYRETREGFRKETNSLFRSTIFAMHDSLMVKNIEPIPGGDTLLQTRRFFLGDSINPFFGKDSLNTFFERDSAIDNLMVRHTSAVVEVFVAKTDQDDSLRSFLRPLAHRIRMDRRNKKFLVHMGPDSLNVDSIAVQFDRALAASDISVPFTVHRIRKEKPGRLPPVKSPPGALVSEVVPFNPVNYYTVYFSSTHELFLKAILPQILFSVFVTLLTGGSFYAMRRNMRTQEKLMEMKNDFISNISHELKTPVATVSVALEALEKFKALDDPRKTNEYLTMAKNELHRLGLMTDKILQTVSFEDRQSELKTALMDLDSEVCEVLSSLKLVFEKRRIDVRYEKQGNDFRMMGNSPQVVTVVYNLLDNAIKYSPESSVITVRLEDCGNHLFLAVQDQGMGIPPVYQKKVFEKFFRVPAGDVHNIKGYGLGLSYVWTVVENHNGGVQLQSDVGKGTCFKIRFQKNTGT